MGRPNRIQFAGACYHIMLQGNNHRDVFLNTQDRRYFLMLLRGYRERCELKVYAYCLLNSYVHLLLETSQPNLSRVMQGFNTSYTKYFNQAHNTAGHVFQGRYKALLVDKENYLLELTRYIHLAPVREGMQEKPWRYQWSSCPAYIESETKESLVDSEQVLRHFARGRLKQSVRYLQYIKEGLATAKTPEELPRISNLFIGGKEFVQDVAKKSGTAIPVADEGQGAAAAQAILTEVMDKHGVDGERLFGRVQWREVATVRKTAIYRIWKEAGLGVTEISRMFNRTPSAVSQLIRSIETSKVSKN
ncbi:MAG: hypothetical protein A2X36_17035 [Elusimicrobia bacterium GWA2_69_24]|nr:MAG: hypothetical protein A2X36_17035 [Elusimicrobia bacterium GWA2_69_24]